MGLKGDLGSIPLWEAFQLISSSKKDGKFQVEYKENKAEIYFKEGKIVYAKTGSLENLEALKDVFLWSKGTFTFVQDVKPPKTTIEVNPLDILFSSDKYVDEHHYFGEFILIPLTNQKLSKDEEAIINLLNGKNEVKDVIDEVNFSKIEALNIIKNLIKNKKVLRINDDPNLLWFYIFWRTWNYLTEEYNKVGIGDKYLKNHYKKFLDNNKSRVKNVFEEIVFPPEVSPLYFYQHLKEENGPSVEDIEKVYEEMTISEKTDWINIYKNIKEFSSPAIKEFVSESLSYLYSLENTPLNKILNFEEKEKYKRIIEEKKENTHLYSGDKKLFEEIILSIYLDGNNSLRDLIDYPLWGEEKSILLLGKLVNDNKIISIHEDKKLSLIYYFQDLWNNIKSKYKNTPIYNELHNRISEFLNNNIQDVKYIIDKIINEYPPNWSYVYQKLKMTTEGEVSVFLENIFSIMHQKENEDIEELIKSFKSKF